ELRPGRRRQPGAIDHEEFLVGPISIGTLPAGKSVTIQFKVTVNDPFVGAQSQVSNQGTVTYDDGTFTGRTKLTDDPTVGGVSDPTVTQVDVPDVTVAVSPSSVAEDGATNLVYTFTRAGSTTNALTVNFSATGTASFTGTADYVVTSGGTFSF